MRCVFDAQRVDGSRQFQVWRKAELTTSLCSERESIGVPGGFVVGKASVSGPSPATG